MLSRIEEELELLERHIQVLKLVLENEPIGIIKLAAMTEMPQHRIRYSLRLLEQKGIIKPSPKGAVSTEKARKFLAALPGRIGDISAKVERIKKQV